MALTDLRYVSGLLKSGFTISEIKSIISGKPLDVGQEQAEQEQAEPEQAEPEQAEPAEQEQAEQEQAEPAEPEQAEQEQISEQMKQAYNRNETVLESYTDLLSKLF